MVPWCLYLHTIVCTDERGTFRRLEIAPKDEPDLWRSTIYFLRSWLISFDFPMFSSKEALSLKVGLEIPLDVFQGLTSNSVPLCLTSWENLNKSANTSIITIIHLHKSGSSLGAISKRMKVPRSSVQTIVRKY